MFMESEVKSGDVIKHKSFRDVACIVRGWDNGLLCVEWVNQGFVNSWSLRKHNAVVFNQSDWLICETPNPVCYRYAVWRQL